MTSEICLHMDWGYFFPFLLSDIKSKDNEIFSKPTYYKKYNKGTNCVSTSVASASFMNSKFSFCNIMKYR